MRVAVAVAAVVAVTLSAAAHAAPAPGWKQLIGDWYDGRIDGVYRCSTYRSALRQLPHDGYTPARGDFQRRLGKRRCVASHVATTGDRTGTQQPSGGRNYLADG